MTSGEGTNAAVTNAARWPAKDVEGAEFEVYWHYIHFDDDSTYGYETREQMFMEAVANLTAVVRRAGAAELAAARARAEKAEALIVEYAEAYGPAVTAEGALPWLRVQKAMLDRGRALSAGGGLHGA